MFELLKRLGQVGAEPVGCARNIAAIGVRKGLIGTLFPHGHSLMVSAYYYFPFDCIALLVFALQRPFGQLFNVQVHSLNISTAFSLVMKFVEIFMINNG